MSTINVDTIKTRLGGQAVTSANFAKMWANYNMVTTSSIRASLNVASLTDNGTGDATINFTNVMADTNYGVVGLTGSAGTGNTTRAIVTRNTADTDYSARAVGSVRMIAGGTTTAALSDQAENCVVGHGSLAS